MTAIDIVHTLRHGGLRVRTAIWLLPNTKLPHLPDEAARLGIGLADVRQPILNTIAPGQRFLSLGVREIIAALDDLCQDNQANDCLLVANHDLLVARLSCSERVDLWDILYRGFPYRSRALLLAMPQSAEVLLPAAHLLNQWRKEGRIEP